jgi:hypothetical protein
VPAGSGKGKAADSKSKFVKLVWARVVWAPSLNTNTHKHINKFDFIAVGINSFGGPVLTGGRKLPLDAPQLLTSSLVC